jgi:hypothetical protein
MDPINTVGLVLCGSSRIAKGIDFVPLISHRHVRRQSRVVNVDEDDEDESCETPGRNEEFLRKGSPTLFGSESREKWENIFFYFFQFFQFFPIFSNFSNFFPFFPFFPIFPYFPKFFSFFPIFPNFTHFSLVFPKISLLTIIFSLFPKISFIYAWYRIAWYA